MLYYPDNILDSFCSGDYLTEEGELLVAQRQKFEEAFAFVDGVQYPLSMVHPDIPQEGDQLGMIGVKNVYDERAHISRSVAQYVKCRVREGLDADYRSTRVLLGGRHSYSDELGFSDRRFVALISKLSLDFGRRSLAVLDAGCGQGYGFKGLLGLDEVDKEDSVGLTLPSKYTWAYPDHSLLHANIMHCGKKREFDLTFSVHGALRYHPTNTYRQENNGMLALLQAVNLTRPGGVILANMLDSNSLQLLARDGILRFGSFFNDVGTGLRVLRHPTVDEVMKYTRPNIG